MKKILVLLAFFVLIISTFVVTASAHEDNIGELYYVSTPSFREGNYSDLDGSIYGSYDSAIPSYVVAYNSQLMYYCPGDGTTSSGLTILLPNDIQVLNTDRFYYSVVCFGDFTLTCSVRGQYGTMNFAYGAESYNINGGAVITDYATVSGTPDTIFSYVSISIFSSDLDEGEYFLIKSYGLGTSDADADYFIEDYVYQPIPSESCNYVIYGDDSGIIPRKISNGISLKEIAADLKKFNDLYDIYPSVFFCAGISNGSSFGNYYYLSGDYNVPSPDESYSWIWADSIQFSTEQRNYGYIRLDPDHTILGVEYYVDPDAIDWILDGTFSGGVYFGNLDGAFESLNSNNSYNSGYTSGSNAGYKNGYSSGYNDGYNRGQQLTSDTKNQYITQGYNQGYNEGVTERNEYYNTLIPSLTDRAYDEGYTSGESDGFANGYQEATENFNDPSSEGYKTIYDNGKKVGYSEGYNIGFAAGNANNTTLEGTILATVEGTSSIITNLLNFEIFGVNLLAFFGSLIFIAVVVILIRFLL